MPEGGELISITEAAQRAGVRNRDIYALIDAGRAVAYREGDRLVVDAATVPDPPPT